MASNYRIEHVARVPRGWRVRTVTQGDHEVRIAFPPGAREKGSGHVVEILHPKHENPGYCPGRSRMSNPAELVLMGANPLSRTPVGSRVEQRKAEILRAKQVEAARKGSRPVRENSGSKTRFAIRWHTGNISHAMRSEEEARKLLQDFHGKGEIIRVNPLPLRRRNPVDLDSVEAETAREIRSGFVARESARYLVMDEPHIPTGDYAELGKLYSLAVKPTESGSTQQVQELVLRWNRIRVISDHTRRQIYFAGGNQELSSAEIRLFTESARPEVDLGECREIIYVAAKYHPEVGNDAAGEEVEWRHAFGEENGIRPHLHYDTQAKRLLLRGGDYRVEDAGIVN